MLLIELLFFVRLSDACVQGILAKFVTFFNFSSCRCLDVGAPAPEENLACLTKIAQEHGVKWDVAVAAKKWDIAASTNNSWVDPQKVVRCQGCRLGITPCSSCCNKL